MKKIISLVLCILLSAFVLSGCSSSDEPFVEKSYTPDTQVSEISLDVQDREIDVFLSDDSQIHIQYYENSKEFYEVSVSGGVLTMNSASDKAWTDYIGMAAPQSTARYLCRYPTACWTASPWPRRTRMLHSPPCP